MEYLQDNFEAALLQVDFGGALQQLANVHTWPP